MLIIQKDESDSNLKQKNELMKLNVPKGTIQVRFQFSAGMFLSSEWIRAHNARYVLMDSMVSLFGSGADLSEERLALICIC